MVVAFIAALLKLIALFPATGVMPIDCECDQDYCHVCESAWINHCAEAGAMNGSHDYVYCMCFDCYHEECVTEFTREFDAIFAAVEFKVSKNGRSMVKGIHATSFKFAKKG